MKLSPRLLSLSELTADDYDHIWDTCCDHGFLGAHLLSTKRSKSIHFVDCNAPIMEKLEQKLRQFFPPNSEESSWYAHTVGAEQCPISNYPGKHLVIVSGVGGELAASIVQQLHETYSAHEVDFLICPTNHTFLVRQELMRCKMGLVSERLIEDNKYFYELILLRQNKVSPLCTTHNETVKPACDEQALNTTPEKTLSAAGEALWQGDPEIAAAYLAQLKQHYSRLLNSNREFATTALEAYGRVSL